MFSHLLTRFRRSEYKTITIITPLDIGSALSSETGGASAPLAKTLSMYMVTVVVIVMALYSLLRKRVSKWENTK